MTILCSCMTFSWQAPSTDLLNSWIHLNRSGLMRSTAGGVLDWYRPGGTGMICPAVHQGRRLISKPGTASPGDCTRRANWSIWECQSQKLVWRAHPDAKDRADIMQPCRSWCWRNMLAPEETRGGLVTITADTCVIAEDHEETDVPNTGGIRVCSDSQCPQHEAGQVFPRSQRAAGHVPR